MKRDIELAIQDILSDPLKALQFDLEDSAIEEGVRRLESYEATLVADHSRDQHGHRRREGDELHRSPAGRALLMQALEPATEALREEIAKACRGRPGPKSAASIFIGTLDPQSVTLTTLRVLLDGLNRPRKLQFLAAGVGHAVYHEAGLIEWGKDHKDLVKRVASGFHTHSEAHHNKVLRTVAAQHGYAPQLPEVAIIHQVGGFLVHRVCELTGFFEIVMERSGAKTSHVVRPTEKLMAWVKKHREALSWSRPTWTPLVIPPKDWTNESNGGYHYALANSLDYTMRASAEAGAMRQIASPTSLAALNHLQSGMRWRINKSILALYKQAVTSGTAIGSTPRLREDSIPESPTAHIHGREWTPAEQAAHDIWRSMAAKIHNANAEARRKALREYRTLETAERLADEEGFYFAAQYDFRGRAYYACPDLNPQGRDVHRALLELPAQTLGEPEGGIRPGSAASSLSESGRKALALHGIGRLGKDPGTGVALDKLPIHERLTWVSRNALNISECARNPSANDWWEKADDPWQFLAFCFAWSNLESHPGVAVQVDGTCNGYQHLSAIAGDYRLAVAVNLGVPGPVPEDIYLRVLHQLGLAVRGNEGLRGRLASAWNLLDRKVVKRPIMTVPYGATEIGIAGAFRKALGNQITHQQGADLAFLLTATLREMFPQVGKVLAYVSEIARLAADARCDLVWHSPSGFLVAQRYREQERRLVKYRLEDRIIYNNVVQVPSKAISKRSSVFASAPNFVQSMDGAHMQLVAEACAKERIPVASIHDCFMFHPNDAERGGQIIREQFVRLYTELCPDPLRMLRDAMQPHIAVELPEPPERPALDLSGVLQNPFFFS